MSRYGGNNHSGGVLFWVILLALLAAYVIGGVAIQMGG